MEKELLLAASNMDNNCFLLIFKEQGRALVRLAAAKRQKSQINK